MISNSIIITELFVRQIPTTGSHPSLFECSDGDRYVVKDSHLGRNYRHLINEYIAAHLAKAANVPSPEFSLVQINSSIIPDDNYTPRGMPSGLGFGSKFLPGRIKNVADIDELISLVKNKKLRKVEDLIKICAFDIWLRNNDRSINNPNLIIQEFDKGIGLIAIDHSSIFATLDYRGLLKEIDEIPPDGDTLVDKVLFETLYSQKGLFFYSIINEACADISNVNDKFISEVVLSVPSQWLLTTLEQKEIIQIIISRKSSLKEHFNFLLKQIGL